MSELIDAIRKKENIQKLIETNDVNYLNKQDENGLTALMIASYKNYKNIVEMLLKKKVDVNIKSNIGLTAISFAVKGDNFDIIKLLIENNTDLNDRYEAYCYETILDMATHNNNLCMVKLLLDNGCDPNTRSNYCLANPIFIAAYCKYYDMMKLLLKYDLKLNIRNKFGNTVLEESILSNNLKCVELLVRYGVDTRIRGNQNKLPIELTNNEEIKRLL